MRTYGREQVFLPNAEEGFRSFLMSLRNIEGMWEDGAAWRGAGTAGSPPSLPCSRRLIISKGGGVKSTNSAVHPSGSIFVCDSLSGRLISKAVSPAAASSSSSPCHPTPRHEIFPAIESFKTCTALNLKPMPACLPAFVSLIG